MSVLAIAAIMMMALVIAVARARTWAAARARRHDIARRREALVQAHLELMRERGRTRDDRADRFARGDRAGRVRPSKRVASEG